MTDQPTANDAAGGDQGGQPSEEELREYLSQLRTVPADRIVLDALTSVLTAAQAKLGRRDARLLIDLSAATLDHTRAHLPDEQTRQFDEVVRQLQAAQVQAEQQVANSGAEEPNDLSQAPAPPQQQAAPAQSQPQQPSPASQLWVPGR